MSTMTEICYQNLRGLRTKSSEFYLNLLNISADIICLTETWLNSSFLSSEYIDKNYVSFRRDRNYSTTTRGGGCWVLLEPRIKANRVSNFETNVDFLEDLWIRIALPSGNLYLCVVYITSMRNNAHLYETFLQKLRENILSINTNDKMLVLGDFNMSSIKWQTNFDGSLSPFNVTSDLHRNLLNTMQFGNLMQRNSIHNHRSETLDLVLSSFPSSSVQVSKSDHSLVQEDRYHPTLHITLHTSTHLMKQAFSFKTYNFKKANYEHICEELNQVNWHFLNNLPINQAVSNFYAILNDLIEKFVPKMKQNNKFPHWYSRDLIQMLKEKNRARRKLKKIISPENHLRFSNLRSQCKRQIKQCHLFSSMSSTKSKTVSSLTSNSSGTILNKNVTRTLIRPNLDTMI